MQFKQLSENQYVLRFLRAENVLPSLQNFCLQNNIEGGFFTGIGAADFVELAHYNVDTQKYSSKEYNQPLEITNFTGNISYIGDEIIIHAHGTFSDQQMNCLGGHVVNLRISATLELFLTETRQLAKARDEETGLNLLNFE